MEQPTKKPKLSESQKEGWPNIVIYNDDPPPKTEREQIEDLMNTKVMFDTNTNTMIFYKGITYK